MGGDDGSDRLTGGIALLGFMAGITLIFLGVYHKETQVVDQEIQKEVFLQCLEKVSQSQEQTKADDWDKVIRECRKSAMQIATKQ